MKRKEAINFINEGLKSGKTKSELYSELNSKIKFKTDLNRYIASVPSSDLRSKYSKLNYILFSLLIYLGLVKTIVIFLIAKQLPLWIMPLMFFAPFILFYLAYHVWQFNGSIYAVIFMLGIASGLKTVSSALENSVVFTSTSLIVDIATGYLPLVLVLVFSYYLRIKVFPYYSFWGQLKDKEIL